MIQSPNILKILKISKIYLKGRNLNSSVYSH